MALVVIVCVQMLRVKQLLTEVLLDVTNTEIVDVARMVYVSARAKLSRGNSRITLRCIAIVLWF